MDRFVFAGGGSGGHLFPAIAVARELRTRWPDCEITFVGSSRTVEGHILGGEPFDRRVIPAAATTDLKRNPLRFAWRHWQGYRDALRWLREIRPRVVIGCGGYASVPAALAANRLGIPLVLLEQNVVPGRATSWLARRARAVCTSFEATAGHLPRGTRVEFTGNPLRAEIAALVTRLPERAGWPGLEQRETPAETHPGFPLDQPRPRQSSLQNNSGPTLVVLGGSQGAASVNAIVVDFVSEHIDTLAGWRVLHQTGAHDESAVRERYRKLSFDADVHAFLSDMAAAYGRADLVISRAGATTLAELACAKLPAILIPYPRSVRDHQRLNAEAFTRTGAAVIATDGSPSELAAALLPLLADPERRRAMSARMAALARTDATQRVAEVVVAASGGALHPLESRL